MTQMRYADPRLWTEGGLSIPLKPGATYHLDDNGPPGLEVRFDNASTPMPLGPGATFRVPDGGGLCAFRMVAWRQGEPSFATWEAAHTPATPVGGTAAPPVFLRRALFEIREGAHPERPVVLSGLGPTFAMNFDDALRGVPLLAFFTAAQLAAARSLVIEFDESEGHFGCADVAAPSNPASPQVRFALGRPAPGALGFATLAQRKIIGAAMNATGIGEAVFYRVARFVMTGPFSPLDFLVWTDNVGAGGDSPISGEHPAFRLSVSAADVEECVLLESTGHFTLAAGSGLTNVTLSVFSDRLRAALATIGAGATVSANQRFVGLSGNLSTSPGYTNWAVIALATSVKSQLVGPSWEGRMAVVFNATAADIVVTNIRYLYAESGADGAATYTA